MAVHNSSKTAYCHFTLSPDFFSKYKIDGTPAQQREGIKCMLHVKVSCGSFMRMLCQLTAAVHAECPGPDNIDHKCQPD